MAPGRSFYEPCAVNHPVRRSRVCPVHLDIQGSHRRAVLANQVTREQKAHARLFKGKPATKPDLVWPSRVMRVTFRDSKQCDLLWKKKHGVWFLCAWSRGHSEPFKHILTDAAFKGWARRSGSTYRWNETNRSEQMELGD